MENPIKKFKVTFINYRNLIYKDFDGSENSVNTLFVDCTIFKAKSKEDLVLFCLSPLFQIRMVEGDKEKVIIIPYHAVCGIEEIKEEIKEDAKP